MANVISPAPSPAQTGNAFDPTTVLELFRRMTRSAITSRDPAANAPTYDPTFPPKDWVDSNLGGFSPTDMVTYNFVDTSVPGGAKISTFSLTVSQAATLNLPGVHSFPMYTVQPTVATYQQIGSIVQVVNPNNLSTLSQAQALAAAWGVSEAPFEWTLPSVTYNWGSESRRQWQIMYNGVPVMVGPELIEQYANGVGTPGSWVFQTGVSPKWVTQVATAGTPVLQPVAHPVRALMANEKLWSSSVFGGAELYRTDMASNYNVSPVSSGGGGGLTTDQDAKLTAVFSACQRIEKDLQEIDDLFGQPKAT